MLQKAFHFRREVSIAYKITTSIGMSKIWVLTTIVESWECRRSSTLMEGHDMTLSSYVFHLVNLKNAIPLQWSPKTITWI